MTIAFWATSEISSIDFFYCTTSAECN